MVIWHVAYWARQNDTTVMGMARIVADRKPSWSVMARTVPGYVTGRFMGKESARQS